jgi:ABC-2 type transport system ATP-binding protein
MSVVEIANLTKTYGPIRAVDDFSLTADKGEIVAVVGPDGAGKTTTFRAACGLINFDSGRIAIAGLDVAREFEKVKVHLGYMPQIFSLYQDLSVEENLRFYAGLFGVSSADFKRKKQILYEFSGLGPFSGRRAGQLSGGMKQKLSLSCILIHDPQVFILDEPTTGVDPVSRQQFWRILKDLRSRGSTIVISTPYMDEVALSDRAAFVYEGRKLAEGTPDELARGFKGRAYRLKQDLDAKGFADLGRSGDLSPRRVGASVFVYAGPGETPEGFSGKLAAAGIRPETIEEVPPSLEDAFVQLMPR